MGIRTKIRRLQMKWYGRFGKLPNPEKWVFLMGATNSGTTLLKHILALHPEIGSMHREGQHYTDQLGQPGKFKRLWASRPEETHWDENSDPGVDVDRLKRQWGNKIRQRNRPIYLEKSPPNALRTLWLQKHFENAYFIGIVRSGYAVAEGIHRKAGHDLDKGATQWAVSNKIMLEDFERLERKLVIHYEELTDFPVETYRRMCEFIGIEPVGADDLKTRVFKFQKVKSTIRNMNYRSFERLTDDQCAIIDEHAGEMLTRLGYRDGG